MSVDVEYGTFYDSLYQAVRSASPGAVMALEFQPSVAKCKALGEANGTLMEFHLVQVVIEQLGAGEPSRQDNAGYEARKAANGWALDMDWQARYDDGYLAISGARKATLEGDQTSPTFQWQLAVDQEKAKFANRNSGTVLTSLDPRYAQQRIAADIPLFTVQTEKTSGNALVLSPPNYAWPNQQRRASLRDAPSVPIKSDIVGMDFEVAALLDYGQADARRSRYLGSVSWGWRRTAGQSDAAINPLALVHATGVSERFTAAVAHWNSLTVDDPAKVNGDRHAVMQIPEQ